MKAVIEARNLVKEYGPFKAVNGVHFRVNQGECFGILGPNGAGKSTLMSLIYGAASLTSGELFLLGFNVRTHAQKIKSQVGVVPQFSGLDDDFSVIDNLLIYGQYFGLSSKESRVRAKKYLRFLRMDEYEDHVVQMLGGGYKRRLAIARALMSHPEIIFLDEPTVGLDSPSRLAVWEVLNDLKAQGKTLVMTTHYMDEAERYCDRIVVMDKGRILAEGSPEHLISEHVGHEVIEFNVKVEDVDYHLRKIKEQFKYQVINSRIRIFIPPTLDGREAMNLVASDNISLRKACLDDVFIRLSGYELRP